MGAPVLKWQLLSKDPSGASTFLSSVFGWRVDADNALGYREVDTGSPDGIGGGIWPAPPGVPSFAQLFVGVDDVEATLKLAVAHGAKVIVPPQKLPDGDEMAVLLAPDGMPFGLMKQRAADAR